MYSGFRRFSFTLVFSVFGALFGTGQLQAGIIVGGPGDAGDCAPFGCSDANVYQQVFDASLFSGPTTIAGLGFRVFDDPLAPLPDTIFNATYHILFSTVQIPVNGLDSTLENNIDATTAQNFFIGSIADPIGGVFSVVTTGPNYYNYDPSKGNLLMQIQTNADFNDPTLTMYAAVNTASGGLFSSASANDPGNIFGCPDGFNTSPCVNSNYGLVVDFLTSADVNPVPEPAPIWLLITPLGVIGFSGWARTRGHRVKSSS